MIYLDLTWMAEPVKGKSSKLRPILIAIPVMLILVGSGLWFSGVLPRLLGVSQREGQTSDQVKSMPPSYIEIPEMIDNLDDLPKSHYVKLSARVEVPRPEDVAQVKAAMPQLQDLLVVYMRDMDTAELRDPVDTKRLRDELLDRANVAVAPAKISDILFTQVLVQ